jgi:glutamine synthetase type III
MKKTTENAKIQELRSQIQGEINELNILKNKIKNITDPVKKQLYEQIMRLREENIREKQKALEALIKIWGK